MLWSSFLCSAMVAFVTMPLTTASPVSQVDLFLNPRHERSSGDLDKRYMINCTDPRTSFDIACWGQLDLSDWLNNPTTGWNKTTPICDATQDSAACCTPGEAWTTCFLRLAHGFGGADCTEINAQTCSLDMTQNVSPVIGPQVHYVLKNIYAINDFFTTYWTALQYAAGQAGLVVQQLVDELDPAKPTTFSWINVVSVLAFGLAFLGAPTIAVGILTMEATNQIKYAAQALLISVSQTPGLAKAFWPSGTDDSKMVQIGQLDKQLGNATQEMANMMNTAVERIMSDMPTFVAFAENGRFSSNQSLSLPSKTDGLNYALTTYLLSETMNKNGWYTSPFLGPYPNAAAVESSTYPGFSCKMGPNNICTMYGDDAEYWSQSTQRVYALTNIKPNDKTRSPLQLTTDIVQNSWAALDVLFDGAYNCTADGKAGSAAINFNLDGTLDIACISQLPVKIPCGVTCYVPLINGQCPFGRTTTGC